MRSMRKTVSFLLIAVLMLCLAAAAFAQTAGSVIVGDIDGDSNVSVSDVTALQMYHAELLSPGEINLSAADANLDNQLVTDDVTCIQRWIALYTGEYYVGMERAAALRKKSGNNTQDIIDAINSFERSKGVDISSHNGDLDMNKIKEAGYTFVMIRLGYGDDEEDQDDIMFETNVRKAEAAGLDWGAYIYSYAMSEKEVLSEVNHTLRLLKGKKPTMPIAFDWEEDEYKERMGMPSDDELRRLTYNYLSSIQAAGYYPILYTGCEWLDGALDHTDIIYNFDIWLAQWYYTYDYHTRPLGMWQYGGETNYLESPYIDGIDGAIDKNFSYKNYPMIIQAYGYNNHEPLLQSELAATASCVQFDEDELVHEDLPSYLDGAMGDSLKNKQR